MLDFPDLPTPGQEYVTASGLTYIWNENDLLWNRKANADPTTNPKITALSPASMYINTTGTLRVLGENFVSTSIIFKDGVAQPTTFVSATELTCAVTAPFATGSAGITVENELASTTSVLTYDLVFRPTLIAVSPNTAQQGSTQTLTVTGADFEAADRVIFNGTAVGTTFISQTELRTAAGVVMPFSVSSVPVNVERSQSNDLAVTLTAASGAVTIDSNVAPGVWPHSGMNQAPYWGNCYCILTSGNSDGCVVHMDGVPYTSWPNGSTGVWFTPTYAGHDPSSVWYAVVTVVKNGVPSANSSILPIGGS